MNDDDFWAKRCDELKDEIERLRNPWQDISTAPKDGTMFVAIDVALDVPDVFLAAYEDYDGEVMLFDHSAGDFCQYHDAATHWIAPPNQKEGGE